MSLTENIGAKDLAVLSLEQIKQSQQPIFSNGSGSLWDLGDGVLNLELTTKQNALGQPVFDVFEKAFDLVEASDHRWQAMTIYSDAKNFAAGANLNEFYDLTSAQDWETLRRFAQRGQDVLQRMKTLNVPVVSGVAGAALGGGCEVILNSTAAVAHTKSHIGLVEVSVGIIPAWGGCAELLLRHSRLPQNQTKPLSALEETFTTILTCRTSTSAQEAKDMLFLRPDDEIVMHRDHVLTHAKSKALSLIGKATSPKPVPFTLMHDAGYAVLRAKMAELSEKGQLKPHDLIVGDILARTLTGAASMNQNLTLSQDIILHLEIDGALTLFQTCETQKRISNLLFKPRS